MRDLGLKPLVAYGLLHRPDEVAKNRHFIIFNCIIPGAIVPMKSDIAIIFNSLYGPPGSIPPGYVMTPSWESKLRYESEQVYQLAKVLEKTEGLSWLYILRTGFVAMGFDEMKKHAPQIMPKMRDALDSVCGPIDATEVPGRELWLPGLDAVAASLKSGVLMPTA